MRTADLVRRSRPEVSGIRLDEIKRDVLSRGQSARPRGGLQALRRRLLAFSLFVLLFAISTSNAAANVLNFISGGTFGSKLGTSGTSGTNYYFGSYQFGGDKSDDAGHETYCPDDKGSDDNDASSGDNSDGDSKSDDYDASSGDKSDEKSDDNDASSGDNSDEKSDDNDASSGDYSD